MILASYKEAPWRNPIKETHTYLVFEDKYPVTEGHLLFVPKTRTMLSLMDCYREAILTGEQYIEDDKCVGYNIGQNIGYHAGQTIFWPHVHFIPRKEGDLGRYENGEPYKPVGGVRNIFPGKGKY